MIETFRPLIEAERRLLRHQQFFLRRAFVHFQRRLLFAEAAVVVPLFLITLAVSKIDWWAIGVMWLAIAALLAALVAAPRVLDLRRRSAACAHVLQRDRVRDLRICSSAYVLFEELDDEGPVYAFQLPNEQLLFIAGQDFYPSARFPNSDFSLVEATDGDGSPSANWIIKHGHRMAPTRLVPATFKRRANLPDHLATVAGDLDNLEHSLLQAAST